MNKRDTRATLETEPVIPSAGLSKSQLADGRIVVTIGICAGGDEAADHVGTLLSAQRIQPFIHGSRVYAIDVLEDDVDRAQNLLRADPKKDQYGIKLYSN